MTRLMLVTAAAAASMLGNVPASHAFGNAPWCAVIEIGNGEVYWDCQYRTVEQCVPNVVSGNRGFCNVNPYWQAPNTAVRQKYQGRHG